MVTGDGEVACWKTTMSVMILMTEQVAARGHVAEAHGDPGATSNSWNKPNTSSLARLSHPRSVSDGDEADGDGSQLRPDLEPESSGEAVEASASSATCESIVYKCSEDTSP